MIKKKKPKPLEYEVNEKQQVVTIQGEQEDVRYFTNQLINITNKQDHLRNYYKECYDEIDTYGPYKDSVPINQIPLNAITRTYYEPGKLEVHPWASKPAKFYFTFVKQHCEEAWQKTITNLIEGSDID